MESLSKSSLDSDPTEERFPLLLLLLEDGAKAKTSDYREESSRLRSAARGAVTLMSRWPCHLLSVVLVALAVATASLITLIVMTVLSSMVTNHNSDHNYWKPIFHPPLSIQSLGGSCQELMMEENRSSYRLSSLSPKTLKFFQTTSNITSTPATNDTVTVTKASLQDKKSNKIFFIYFESEDLTVHEMCSIESAAKFNRNITCFVMVIHETEQWDIEIKNTKLIELTEAYANIQLVNVNGDAYFSSSPLYDLWKKYNKDKNLKKFAARAISVWQYGGTTYDLEIITLNETAPYSFDTDEDTIMLEVHKGLIIDTKVQCHAFLYDLMKILSKMTSNSQNNTECTIKNVIEKTFVQFCNNGTIVFQNDSITVNYTCHGVKEIPPKLICDSISEKDTCLWTSSNLPLYSKIFGSICPVSFKVILT